MYLRPLLAFLILACSTASAEVVFEAFYRTEKDGKHVGYFMQRVSRNAKDLVIQAYSRNSDGYRSYHGVVRNGVPVSAVESKGSVESTWSKSTSFQGQHAIVKNWNKGSPAKIDKFKLAKGVFPTAFLTFTADLPAMKAGKKYWYNHFIESQGYPGTGLITKLSAAPVRGTEVFQLLNNPSGQEAESFVTKDGFVVASRSPANGSVSYWVRTRQEAVGNLPFPTAEFTKLFGDLPEGKKNPWNAIAGFSGVEVLRQFKMPVFDPRTRVPSAAEEVNASSPLPVRRARP